MDCFKCDKLVNNYKIDKNTCASCRDVLKIDIVRILLQMDPVYLSESNRNKHGRKSKLSATNKNDIYHAYQRKECSSMRELAKKYNVSVGTIHKIIHNYP